MIIEVVVWSKDHKVNRFSFEKESVMLGRSSGNDIQLEDGGVSRYHSRIWLEDGVVLIEDLNSTNGTFVNGVSIQKSRVSPVDEVIIGDHKLNICVKVQPSKESEHQEVPRRSAAEPAEGSAVRDGRSRPKESEPVQERVTREPETSQGSGSQPPAPGRRQNDREEGDDHPSQPRQEGLDQESFYWKALESFLGPIWSYLLDSSVTEVLVNGPTEIYIEQKGQLRRARERFTADQLNAAILNIAQYVGRRVSEEEPYLDARLPDGSRVAILLPPCSRKGASLSIRKFSKEKLTIEKLIQFGSLSPEMVTFLEACVVLKKNIVVSGGTSSGKTSLLNVVSSLIPDDERILTIEDAAELQLSQEHVLPMETRPPDKKGKGQVTIRDLVRASLRMRPDRIIVGEIRSGEALDLLQAMNTGHSGSMCTVHASSPAQALTRLETLALFSGLDIPVRALREQVSTAIDYIIQAARLPDHSRKVTHISEVAPLAEDGSYRVRDIFRYVRTGSDRNGRLIGEHQYTGNRPNIMEELELAGLTNALKLF